MHVLSNKLPGECALNEIICAFLKMSLYVFTYVFITPKDFNVEKCKLILYFKVLKSTSLLL